VKDLSLCEHSELWFTKLPLRESLVIGRTPL
jgi:hypothetical protein